MATTRPSSLDVLRPAVTANEEVSPAAPTTINEPAAPALPATGAAQGSTSFGAANDLMRGLARKTGNADVDAVVTTAPQREEIMIDKGKGGGLMRLVRHAAIWFGFGRGDAARDPSAPKRLRGADIRADVLPNLKPGDTILCGNRGSVSHALVYIGDGKVVHSMATEDT